MLGKTFPVSHLRGKAARKNADVALSDFALTAKEKEGKNNSCPRTGAAISFEPSQSTSMRRQGSAPLP